MIEIGERVTFKDLEGVVRFVGETRFAPGLWVGVELTTRNGKNDGSVKGDRYFTCEKDHGIFVRESMLSRNSDRSAAPLESSEHSSNSSVIENVKLKTIVQRLEGKLERMHLEITSLKIKLGDAKEKNDLLQGQVTAADEGLEILSIDKETLTEQNELLKQDIEDLTEKNQKLQVEVEQLREEIKLLQDVSPQPIDLAERNTMLEKALLTLRDRTEELEQQLETALIELKSREDAVEDSNKLAVRELQEKVSQLEKARLEQEDIEALHIDTERELQSQVDSLERIIDEKQLLITELKADKLQLIQLTEQSKYPNGNEIDKRLLDDLELKLNRLKQHKISLDIDHMVLQREVNEREDLEKEILKRSSVNVDHNLGSYIDAGDDVQVNLLGELFRLRLRLFGTTLRYIGRLYESSSTRRPLALTSVQMILSDCVQHIKDQEYGNIPNFSATEHELIQEQLLVGITFENNLTLQYELESQICACDCILTVVELLKNKGIEENSQELTELFRSSSDRISRNNEILKELERETLNNNEITKCTIKSITTDVISFLENIISGLAVFSLRPENLLKESKTLLHTLSQLPGSIKWESHSVEVDELSEKKDENLLSSDVMALKSNLSEKEQKIEEYEAKIEVLQMRLESNKETEKQMKKYRDECMILSETNATISAQLEELLMENKQLTKEVQKSRNNNLLFNAQFETITEQKKFVDHMDLVSEIHTLRNTVRHFTSLALETTKYDWLSTPLPCYEPFHREEADELRDIGKSLRELVTRKLSLQH
ncbi:Dynactin, 150 kDa isoform AltName: Full=150 kDa dynein-associated polypeptide; AltName: Full=DAP-150; Short=DP-150; AltName: Full=p150-glued [Cyberlindnera jadinii]|uniref:CAP-Gly domain-containing protein n=1 Tax=Cyberlindnera jadinii (strain ATCC 18201 / CBS 1600 / BCRC 20928 / JCM 3617 / NBRC 0987 / NRRL Y-1542) TaxID=983966 RepID=A0A0H5BZ92_CYBJN|nr:Dynactin, 150 kDa isoform AltName: Full=150 kDa dynein-associated polypeptide; AltName: Full=DAP-150; Short=DP-150; AltName: Full=p150-glued [Cyberlindnera jadinii]